MSLTLQPDTEAQTAAPSRRSALREAPRLPADTTEIADAPMAALILPGWYADPMGSAQSRWWDGNAWTAELSSEASAKPAEVVEVPVVPEVPFVAEVAEVPVAEGAAPAPQSRRQLREMVGPLTTGPVLIEAAAHVPPAPVPLVAPTEPDARSPFEALFESSPAERETAESAVFDATAFLDPTAFLDRAEVADSSIARPWIGAAAPLVPAASAPSPVPVQPAPTFPAVAFAAATTPFAVDELAPVAAPASMAVPAAMPAGLPARSTPSTPTFSAGALGFTLPPDPFAGPSGAALATPGAFVPRAPVTVAASTVPTLAVPARSTTAAVWLFALLPVVHVAAIWLVLGLRDLGGDPVIRYSVLGAPLFLYLVLAFADRRVLRARGFQRTAPTVLGLIPPLYLLVRAIRVGAAGVVPLLAWLLVQTAAYFFLLLQLPGIFALVPLAPAENAAPAAVVSGPITEAQRAAELTPSGMAAELTRQTLAKNLRFSSISCPTIPVTLDGTAVACVGTLASVKMNLNVVIDSSLPNSAFALVSEAPAV